MRDTYLQVINVCLQARFTLISFTQKSGRSSNYARNILTTVLMSSRLSAPRDETAIPSFFFVLEKT